MSISTGVIIIHSKIDFCINPDPHAIEVIVVLHIKDIDSMDYSYYYNNEGEMHIAAEYNQHITERVMDEVKPREYFSDLLIIIS
jgi:hypothetical protein